MPRRYTRGYSRRYYGRRKKWTPVFLTEQSTVPGAAVFAHATLAANQTNQGSTAPIATNIKVKNFKVAVDVQSAGNVAGSPSVTFAIVFVPQSYAITANLMVEHPEWVMAWRTIDLQTTNTVQVSSRLARNLNSGDKVVFFLHRSIASSGDTVLTYQVMFYTCNN